MSGDHDEFIPTRRSLITRLKNWDDQQSWQEFFDTYWRLIYSVALKAGLSPSDSQDIVQETVVSVARQMPGFHYDPSAGSFKSWLMVITRRRIVDHLRKRARTPQNHSERRTETGRTATLDKLPDPAGDRVNAVWDEEWQKNVFAAAVKKVKQKVGARQFQLFDCYALKGWPVELVARNLNATTGQIYTAKSRVAALIKEEIQRLETAMV